MANVLHSPVNTFRKPCFAIRGPLDEEKSQIALRECTSNVVSESFLAIEFDPRICSNVQS